MNKNKILILIIGIFLVSNFSFILAIEASYCCEKTITGAWCQNAPGASCDSRFRKAPTSCESTSYCKLGCCYNSQEGTCMENTPQKVCEDSQGIWGNNAKCEIPQCGLGCCLIGDQAAFVTQTRCKKLASLYGLEINFRTDIKSEIQCIASTTSETKGACVFEENFEKTCTFTTKKKCLEMKPTTTTATESGGFLGFFKSKNTTILKSSSGVTFYEDYLCSADSLATNCGPTEKTTCLEGRDEVYFVDSCGNPANIYDSSKINDKSYWSKIVGKIESCGNSNSNADSATCGNCDYFLGSFCKNYKSGTDKKSPNYGDNICRNLGCVYDGKTYNHGETWCSNSQGTDKNLPGSRYFRLICYNGEVSVEPCSDFRQEICIQAETNNFKTAACRVNKWQDCSSQKDQSNCENSDRRDCKWVDSEKIKCAPKFSPGFDFWRSESNSQSICSSVNTQCVIKYKKGFLGGEECIENCECEGEGWKNKMNGICTSMGDCGSKINFLGVKGYNK